MSSKEKLEKVLEYLIAGKADRAKDLLHNVFIEKARAIHEDLMNMDDDMDHESDLDDFHHDLEDPIDDLEGFSDEIEAEETMAEDADLEDMGDGDSMVDDTLSDMGDDDVDMMDNDLDDLGGDDMQDDDTDMLGMDDDLGDDDHSDMGLDGDVDVGAIESSMSDLEDALAQLKAEFEKLEAQDSEGTEDQDMDADMPMSDEEDTDVEHDEDEDEEVATDDDNEEMDESWLNEFDDLEESVSLEKVSMPSGEGEIGAGHYAPVETNKKSPVASAPTSVLGAKPVKTGEGATKSGYNRETAPATKGELPHTGDNRRKKSTDKMSKVSKEGDASAKLNKGTSDGFGEVNKTSPLSKSPRK